MKSMIERMLKGADALVEQSHPYVDRHHDPEKGMAVYKAEDETIFLLVMQVDKWHDMEKKDRHYIEDYIQHYMLSQDDIQLCKINIAVAQFIITDDDKALVRLEFQH